MVFRIGEPVTVLPPYDDDPLILAFQHYAKVAAILNVPTTEAAAQYMVELDAAVPHGCTYGPFGADRLAKGWRDRSGRWLVG